MPSQRIPGGLLGDPAPDGEAVGKGLADALRLDRAAAERDQAAAAERLEGQPLLGLAKARLAVAREDLGGRRAQLALDLRVDVETGSPRTAAAPFAARVLPAPMNPTKAIVGSGPGSPSAAIRSAPRRRGARR